MCCKIHHDDYVAFNIANFYVAFNIATSRVCIFELCFQHNCDVSPELFAGKSEEAECTGY